MQGKRIAPFLGRTAGSSQVMLTRSETGRLTDRSASPAQVIFIKNAIRIGRIYTVFKLFLRVLFAIEGLLLLGSLGHAQSFLLDLPRPSQHAVITQRIGITDVTINYHRPMVNKRKLWAALVPHGHRPRAPPNQTP